VGIHAPLREEGEDVLVRSINGNGLTFSTYHWKSLGLDWKRGPWPWDHEITLDMCHATHCPGERWVTASSFIDHIGRTGLHANPGIPEYALNPVSF
jgi:hypothetical protein